MDIQRNIDRENMYEIIKTLRKCRKKQSMDDLPQVSALASKTKQTPSKKKPFPSKVVGVTPGSKKPMSTQNKKR